MAVIVIAEDNEQIRVLTARYLRRAGHTVIATSDGAEALAAVREYAPDAVLTDVDMPRMTGLELCRAIRDDPHTSHLPVLVVSGSISPEDAGAASAGVTAVLGKPFAPDELSHRLDELLTQSSQYGYDRAG